MKKKYLKWIGRGLLGMAVLILIAAAAFYFFELKPRIDVVMSVGRAFADSAGDGGVLELDLEDGQQILLDIGSDDCLDGVVYMENAVYDGLEFGYMQEGLWVHFAQVSSYYLLPWTDDVQKQINESALISLLELDEGQKADIGTGLLELRGRLLAEEEDEFSPTWLNRLLGLECLKADILDLYRGISFYKAGTQNIDRGDETLLCTKYVLGIPEEYVKPLLKTDGAGEVLEVLGDILGDISLEVYICQGTLVYIDVDTSFLYMPCFSFENGSIGNLENVLRGMEFSSVPLKGGISIDENGDMEIEVRLITDHVSIKTALTWKLLEKEAEWKYDPDEALNIFQVGYFRMLLEAKKWEEALNGKSFD